jgi:hypothetical protein
VVVLTVSLRFPLPTRLSTTQTMSEEVNLLRAAVVTLKAKEHTSNEVIDGMQSSVHDLQEMFLREVAVDDSVSERFSKSVQDPENMSSKKKETAITQQGDVLSRQRPRQPPVALEEPSDEGENSSDDFQSRPDLTWASVPDLKEQGTSHPEYKTLVSYRAYHVADSSQKADAVVSGKSNAQLKRLRHCVN